MGDMDDQSSPPSSNHREDRPAITVNTAAETQIASSGRESTLNPNNLSIEEKSTFSDSSPISPYESSPQLSKTNGASRRFLSVPGSPSFEDGDRSSGSYDGDTLSPPSPSKPEAGFPHSAHSSGADTILHDADALKPDPGTEDSFKVKDNRFAFSPGQLSKLLNPKSLAAFYALGGLRGLEKGLRSNRKSGLSADETTLDGRVTFEDVRGATFHEKGSEKADNSEGISRFDTNTTNATGPVSRSRSGDSFADRKRVFAENRLPEKKAKSIFELAWCAYNDRVLILLTIAAVISLALGLYQTFGQPRENGEAAIEWVEGVAIMAAIVIVVFVGAINDWQKERQFVKLNKKKEDRHVKVIRSGKSQEISIFDLLVGDVMHLEPGDLVPVDGVLISGHGIKCDESSATGESDLLRKQGADEVMKTIESQGDVRKLDPFIISGSKVCEGTGTFMVTAVGVHSTYGKTMMALREDMEVTPLQQKLNILANYIAKLGGSAALFLFVVLLIKFLAKLPGSTKTPSEKGQDFLQIVIQAITVIVVAVPEGLPLAVTLALAFATTKMLKDNNLVRVLRACETMGNATTVCSDKTGTLTQNKMTTVAGTVGTDVRFGDNIDSGVTDEKQPLSNTDQVSVSQFVSVLSKDVKSLLLQSIAINSTAFEGEQDGQHTFIGSKTETALLNFARDHLGMGPISEEQSNVNLVQVIPFDSGRKCMGSVIKLGDGTFRMYVKGASEILLKRCTTIIQDPSSGLSITELTASKYDSLNGVISAYASRSLRTIALIYRDFQQWPPEGAQSEDGPSLANFDLVFKEMVFFGVVGIQDPLRDGVNGAVHDCQQAGVFVRMVTGDNVMTARAIAKESGIYTEGGLVMEGPEFRKMSPKEMDRVLPHLQVLARSSPEDKRILVKRLKQLGETVAVTGDGTNDAPALKTADVGFSMGIAGTEVAKEASDIILMDDNFSSIVKGIMWGRAVNDAVKKFLQFQITVNITAVIVTCVSAVASADEESVLTAVQLLWVNLIMDTFAALALATDPPTRRILNRKPDRRTAPLITVNMWKMIVGQALYQLTVTFILHFAGARIFSYRGDQLDQLKSMVFNTFVWMQIFNQYNNRRLDNHFNIFEGVHRNKFFIGINMIMVAFQIMIIFIGGDAFHVTRLNGTQWACSIVLGFLSLPVAVLIRLVPDEFAAKFIPRRYREDRPVAVSDEEGSYEWNPALMEIKDELDFLKKVRGGRLNTIKFRLQRRREKIFGEKKRPVAPPPAAPSRKEDDLVGPASAPAVSVVVVDHSEPTSPAYPELAHHHQRGGSGSLASRSRSNSGLVPAAAMAGIVAGSIGGWSPV